MAQVIERDIATHHGADDLQAEEIARDLKLMDELDAFVQSLPRRMEGRTPTVQEMRELAYEDREAASPII